ncbi:PLDc N-terminal domain-containing protein [Prosthecobacter sp.]|uniref:PLDc N-terminal domain-containing protein n=1 Tax=Prosthecobacter sp. TaxID=1965333 RepID=UPI0031F33231
MLTLLIKFLTLAPENVSKEVYWALGAIYFIFIIATILSIKKTTSSLALKLAWILLVTFLPVIGIAIYCIRCLASSDFHFLKQFSPAPPQGPKHWNS